jgi:hypothetical protein
VARKSFAVRLVPFATLVALVLAVVPGALGAKLGGAGRAGTSTRSGCTQNPPRVSVDNTWAWASPGSWGLPGQQLKYAIDVFNNDVGCGSSSFVVSTSAPSGFAVSMPSSTITLNSASTGYLWAYVTSPTSAAGGDYPLSVAITRAGTSSANAPSTTSYYKVYTSDTAAPTLSWPNPWDGSAISGRSYNVVVSSNDDHAVKQIDLYIDNAYTSTTLCDNISSTCQLSYKWSIRRVHGQHTATFRSTDWMGNVGALAVTFTVN